MRSFFRELGFYGMASAAALGVDMGLLALLVTAASVQYLVAATISFVAGGLLLYVLSTTVIFRFRRIGNRTLELSYFAGLGSVGLVVNAAVIYLVVEMWHLHFMIAKLLAAGCTFGTNFLLRRYILFSPVRPSQADACNRSR
jgi:putative flippase GtrA